MNHKYILGITALCLLTILVLQGRWMVQSYHWEAENLKKETSKVLREAVEQHTQYLLRNTPKDTRIETRSRATDLPEITVLIEQLHIQGYPLSLPQVDSIATGLLKERQIHSDHAVQWIDGGTPQASHAIPSDTCYTRTDKSQGLCLYLTHPHRLLYQRLNMVWIATGILTILALTGLVYLMKGILNRRKMEQEREIYANALAHEMLTPISSQKLSIEALHQERVQSDKATLGKYLNLLRHSNFRLHQNAIQMLKSGALIHNRLRIRKEVVDLERVLLELFRIHAIHPHKKVHFEKHITSGTVFADPDLLESILSNLIANSIKYSDAEVHITLFQEEQPGYTLLKVHDDGWGIPPKDQKRIFQFSMRGLSNEIPGLGMGLTYVKEMMKAQGGKVTVQSVQGEYSVFTLYFPSN